MNRAVYDLEKNRGCFSEQKKVQEIVSILKKSEFSPNHTGSIRLPFNKIEVKLFLNRANFLGYLTVACNISDGCEKYIEKTSSQICAVV